MRTCGSFATIKAGYERDITYLRNRAERHNGTPAAQSSTGNARAEKARMARHLSRHFEGCLLCS